MKLMMPVAVAVVALAITASAQETTVKSRTKVKADEGKVMTMSGCLHQDLSTSTYLLTGTMLAGDKMKSKSKVKTDVGRNDVSVKGESRTSVDNPVATSGATSTFTLVPRNNVDLASYVGRPVQLSAIVVEKGHGDADVKIEEKTTVDPEHGRDSTTRSKTKVEVPRSPYGSYAVVAVKAMPGTCPAH